MNAWPMPLPTPLISATELATRLAAPTSPPLRVFDARFDLMRPEAGAAAFAEGHIPGATYLHLDRALSAKFSAKAGAPALCGGRHPLPSRAHAAQVWGALGVTPATPVVVCDDQGGMYAARAWWLLRWLGHAQVAVLDGGLRAWREAGGALESGPGVAHAAAVYPVPAEPAEPADTGMGWVDAAAVRAGIGRQVLIDARAPERYRGDVEPLDPVAGHIPGALNRPFSQNLGPDGRFLGAAALRAAFEPLLAGRGADAVVHQCGSGVTACHNILAMTAAGLPGSKLYAGSWSEWCSDPTRPVARG